MSKISKSAATLLTWLYGAALEKKRPVVWGELLFLFPGMSTSGRRSLVFQLRKKKLVTVDAVGDDRFLTITTYGIAEIIAHFPALSDDLAMWQGDWSVLVFLNSPSFDPQFRFLRQFLIDHHFGQLSRGVYLFPGPLPQAVEQQLHFYPGFVAVLGATQWQFGDERSIIGSLFSLTDLCNSLSGISKEVFQLLAVQGSEKELMFQNSSALFVVFDRLLSILEFDIGIHQKYFPQVERSRDLLCRLQQLFKL